MHRLSEMLAARCAASPDGVAIVDGERHVTLAEFDELCRRMVAWLRAQGVGPGDRVAVWLVNRVEWLALLFGLARLGAVLATVNTRYRAAEVAYILRKSRARLLVTQAGFRRIDFLAILDGIASIPDGINAGQVFALERIAVLDADAATPASILGRPVLGLDARSVTPDPDDDLSDPDATVILFPTSGTTSGPKLVMHPQRTVVDHARRCASAHRLEEGGTALLAALPLCGVFGLNSALAALAAGASVILMDAFEGDAAARLIERYGVTHLYGSDEMFTRLMDARPGLGRFPTARVFGFASFTTNFADTAAAAWERGLPFHGLYGSSEVLALFALQPSGLPLAERVEGGGVPVAGATASLRIRDAATGELAPAGVAGELEIFAPSLTTGYFEDPAATAKAFSPDGFFRTGDLCRLRDDGSMVYEARMGDAMRLGGFLVNPAEIEAELKRMPGVADVQVVAVPVGGRPSAVAFLIAEAGHLPDGPDILARLRGTVAAFKVPARVWVVDRFPMTDGANGLKVQRNKLRDMALERLAAEPRDP